MSARWKLSFGVLTALSGAAIGVFALQRTEPTAHRSPKTDATEPFSLTGGWRAYQWPGTRAQPPQATATLEAARGLAARMSSSGEERSDPPTTASAPAVAGFVVETPPARLRPTPGTVPPTANPRGASDRSGSSTAVITTLPVVELRPLGSAVEPERSNSVDTSADTPSPPSDGSRAGRAGANRQAKLDNDPIASTAAPVLQPAIRPERSAAAEAAPRKARPVAQEEDDKPDRSYRSRARRPLLRRVFVERELGPLEILRLRAP